MTEYTAELASTAGDVQAAIDAGIQSTQPHKLDTAGRFYAVNTPQGGAVHLIDLEREADEYLDEITPRRKTGTYAVHDAKAFVDYLDKHGRGPDVTEVWADITGQTVVGVLDAHEKTAAGWGGHRVVLKLHLTPAWKAWLALNRKPMLQVDFANHLEDRRLDVVNPDAATLTEIARTFKAKKSVQFMESRQLSTGQVQLQYSEEIDAKAGPKGNVEIPEAFDLGLVPFEGSDRYEMGARLRFDISTGRLQITYVLDRPEETLRAAFGDVLEVIEHGVDAPVFRGVPA